MVELDIEVEDLHRLERALRNGVNDGAGETARWAVDEGRNRARDLLRIGHNGHPRIWQSEVYHGFRHTIRREGNDYSAELRNIAPHAHIVEMGRRPGATPPPVQALMDWVVDKLNPAPVSENFFDNPELHALADAYGPGYVVTAFNVQDKIEREGIAGIRFMGRTENYLKQITPAVAHRKVEKHIERSLKQHGI